MFLDARYLQFRLLSFFVICTFYNSEDNDIWFAANHIGALPATIPLNPLILNSEPVSELVPLCPAPLAVYPTLLGHSAYGVDVNKVRVGTVLIVTGWV